MIKKTFTYLFVLFVSLSFLFVSCNKQTKKTASKSDIDTISVTFAIDTTYVLKDSKKKGFVFKLVAKGDFPQNESIRKDLIKRCFSDSVDVNPQEVLLKYRNLLISDFQKTYCSDSTDIEGDIDSSEMDSSYIKECDSETDVYRVFLDKNIIAYCNESSGYYWLAAHGYHILNYYVYDLKTGKRINEESTFIDGYQEKLGEILVKNMIEQYGASDFNDLLEKRMLSVDRKDILPNDNFYVTPNGLVYVFNEYEIAAYAAGETKVSVPFSEISDLMKKGCALEQYFNTTE